MPGREYLGNQVHLRWHPHVHDEWTKKMFDTGKYKSGEIYGRPSDPALIKEYEEYLKSHVEPRIWERYQKQMSRR